MAKNKYYVVWKGITPGVYDNWGECKAQVDGQDGAKYKSFETKEEATKAFEKMPSACRISLFFRHLIAYRQLSANLSTITDRQIVGHGIEEVCGQR